MKNIISALVSLTLLGSLNVGCGNVVDSAQEKASASDTCEQQGRAGDHEYVFSAGSAQLSRIVRHVREDGSETLSADTTLAHGKLKEYAEIGADGRLAYADVSFVSTKGVKRRVIVDTARSAFYVQDVRGAAWQRMPTDAPWVLANLTGEGEAFLLDRAPVSGWIAARAASASNDLRVIDTGLRRDTLAAADQFVVTAENGERYVATGATSLVANDDFITSMGSDSVATAHLAISSLRPKRTAQR